MYNNNHKKSKLLKHNSVNFGKGELTLEELRSETPHLGKEKKTLSGFKDYKFENISMSLPDFSFYRSPYFSDTQCTHGFFPPIFPIQLEG